MEVKGEQAEKFSDLELVNLLAVSLPFHPAEKQALLEAPTLKDRENMLIDLLRLGAGPLDGADDQRREPSISFRCLAGIPSIPKYRSRHHRDRR